MKKIIINIMLVLTIFACNDQLLEKQPLDMISDKDVWSDPALIDAYLAGVYHCMPFMLNESPGIFWVNSAEYNSSVAWVGPALVNELSDECQRNWLVNQNTARFDGIRISGGVLECWDYSYMAIRMLNDMIERLPDSPVANDIKTAKIAEARFLRAFNYFSLVKRYGGVPIIERVQQIDDPEDELYPARNSERDVYDFIISEMDAIEGDLNDVVSTGRPTNTAALALKCRAALYAGSIAQHGAVQLSGLLGFNASEAEAYYQKAYDAAQQVMTERKHSLYDADADKVENFKNVFLVKTEMNNPEPIWVVRHNDVDLLVSRGNGWGWDFLQAPAPHAWTAGNQSGVFLEMAESFEYVDGTPGKLDRDAVQQGVWTTGELWKDRDPRFYASIYTMNTPWKGGFVDWHKHLLQSNGNIIVDGGGANGFPILGTQTITEAYGATGFGIMKYLTESVDNMQSTRTNSPTDWQIFRYGEILLNYAEAAFELGKTGDALDAVNALRDRAGIEKLTSINREQIRNERKVELAFEGHRYWDLRRWRIAVAELNHKRSGIQYILDLASAGDGPDVTPDNRFKIVIEEAERQQPVFQEWNYYFPITQSRTGANPNLLENPDYR